MESHQFVENLIFLETTTCWGIGKHLFHRLGRRGLLTVRSSDLRVMGLGVTRVKMCGS